jgi:hypothetical protein
MSFFKALFSPKVRAKVIIRGSFNKQRLVPIHDHVRAWSMPGFMRAVPESHIEIELEGRQANLERHLDDFGRNPLLRGARVMEITLLPYRGQYGEFRFAF